MPDDYRRSAPARTKESAALFRQGHLHGANYMAGYVIECWIKEYMDQKGIDWKTMARRMPQGAPDPRHDLRWLLHTAGLSPTMFVGRWESAFIQSWQVAMRYRPDDFAGQPVQGTEMFKAAFRIAGNIRRRVI